MEKFIRNTTKKSFEITRNLVDTTENLTDKALDPVIMRKGFKVNTLVNGLLLTVPVGQLVLNQKLNGWGLGIGVLSATSLLINLYLKRNQK
ncbi:hypothetical protein [Carnobacterium maltaromaticum]|uniref:hypothetical protein n=1 Tax=Carnobacterium maltaromaticum TaxID=2751 RepID=UPI0039AFC337